MKTPFEELPVELPSHLDEILSACPGYTVARNEAELVELAVKDRSNGWHEVAYDVPGMGSVTEARVCRVHNGIAANYVDPYMRRRDPECMLIADDQPTDKPRFKERFDKDFEEVRQETFEWLKTQELALFLFMAGGAEEGLPAMAVAPANAGFFALGLALLQGILDPEQLPGDELFAPKSIIYVAPPFRHSHFGGKQIVVHNRLPQMHELFSYNLYPGPSAKKGVYGVLINHGEKEGWVTAHCATVRSINPAGEEIIFMHEGASGGGKSEILQHMHREEDGSLRLAWKNGDGGGPEEKLLSLADACDLMPVTDDMAMCHPSLQSDNGGLALMDAEQAWFIRVNHITESGTDPHLEHMTVDPSEPLLFLNIQTEPGDTALIWNHIMDEAGDPCPNPRVVIPRRAVPDVVDGPVKVDVRSFGVRTPPCTRELPTFGIIGLMHVLPPALAWLWRLAAPRGHDNPSIIDTEMMTSEGVGSYWPFATGRMVSQANLLLEQFAKTSSVLHILCPNQHVGAWETGFMPEWIAREYLSGRGSHPFSPDEITPARCPLLGYALGSMEIAGQTVPDELLRVELQEEVGNEAYDAGAGKLIRFFHQEIEKFDRPDLDPVGRRIIQACLQNAPVETYEGFFAGARTADI